MPGERVFLSVPPADKSAKGKADLAAFRATPSQQDSERWVRAGTFASDRQVR
jgi:hypothetical protein